MRKRSKSTVIKGVVRGFDERNKRIFNRDVFSIYEGIIEKIDIENGMVSVRIPELDDTLYDECRVVVPCNTDSAAVLPLFLINTHVIVGFKQFNLAYPVILGQIASVEAPSVPFEENTIKIKNGNSEFKITDDIITLSNGTSAISISGDSITLGNGSSVVSITASGISINGSTVTANGEDLSVDEKGGV